MALAHNTDRLSLSLTLFSKQSVYVYVHLMLMYDANSQIMFAILLTLVLCHINTDMLDSFFIWLD